MSDVSDEDATRMLVTCLQQVVRVVLVEFGERHDTRTNEQHYTAADHRPTNQVSARQAKRGSRPTRATSAWHPRENVGSVDEHVTRMLLGCYEETAPVKFRLYLPPAAEVTFPLSARPPVKAGTRFVCVRRPARGDGEVRRRGRERKSVLPGSVRPRPSPRVRHSDDRRPRSARQLRRLE